MVAARRLARAPRPHFSAVRHLVSANLAEISEEDRFLFDLNGFIIVPGVLSADEVREANTAIDARIPKLAERTGTLRNTPAGTSKLMAGDGSAGRKDLGGCLEWGKGSTALRSILAHERLLPFYRALMGEGYRMDHMPLIIAQDEGSEGFALHGGRIDHTGHYAPFLAYSYNHGVMHNPLLAVSVMLSDHGPGDGGFCVLKGSHKSNFPTPERLKLGHPDVAEHLHQPVSRAGDVVIFSEGTVHGANAWTAKHQRRVALYRFAPAHCCYGRSYYPEWPASVTQEMTEAQLATLQPPYSLRLDRPVIDADGSVDTKSRPDVKKEFDRTVFGTKYF